MSCLFRPADAPQKAGDPDDPAVTEYSVPTKLKGVKAWFVSDIHITSAHDPKLEVFNNFLAARLRDGTSHLFLVGDIFDLWVGRHAYFIHRYRQTAELIRALVASRVAVHYFEGNHDLHLKAYWADELGVTVHDGPAYFDLGRFRVRVEHGDQMNPEDRGYHFLRFLLRTPFLLWLETKLPGSVIQMIGQAMSRTSRSWTSSRAERRRQNQGRIRDMIIRHVQQVFPEGEFDFFISGHVHVKVDETLSLGPRSARVINLGWWGPGGASLEEIGEEKPSAYTLTNESGHWYELPISAPRAGS